MRAHLSDNIDKKRQENFAKMTELRDKLIAKSDPLRYVERGKMLLGYALRLDRLPK